MRRALTASAALLLVGGAVSAQQPSPPAQHGGHAATPQAQQRPMTDEEMTASAMSAAPKSVAEGATIIVMDANHNARTLRRGTNGWTCMPDSPVSPGQDPMCLDQNAMEWAAAWIGRKPPPDRVGFVFMLAGGSDASNTNCTAPGSLDNRLSYAARLRVWSCQAARMSLGLRWPFFSMSHSAL